MLPDSHRSVYCPVQAQSSPSPVPPQSQSSPSPVPPPEGRPDMVFRDSYRRGGALGYPPPNIGSPPQTPEEIFEISSDFNLYHLNLLKSLKKATLQLLPTPPCPLFPPLSGKSCMNPWCLISPVCPNRFAMWSEPISN